MFAGSRLLLPVFTNSVTLVHLKSRPGPLSSSTVVTPPFIPSEAPPWDSRLVSGAGVVHYHSLHRPRSVPTALGPAPLVTLPVPSGKKKSIDGITWSFSIFRKSDNIILWAHNIIIHAVIIQWEDLTYLLS